jgi:C4-dicarboxylate-binding protein DctP
VADHVVDAQENPLTNLVQFGLYHTHRHVSLTAHFFGFTVVLVNRARFDAWPQVFREALQAAVRQSTALQRKLAIDEDERCLRLLQADGIAIVPPAAIDRAAFKAAVVPLLAREAARLGPDVVAELQG